MIHWTYLFISSLAAGTICWKLTGWLIARRVSAPLERSNPRSERSMLALWWAGAAVVLGIARFVSASLQTFYFNSIYFLLLMMISQVDWSIRKIPNEALAAILLVRLIQITLSFGAALFGDALLGLLAGYFLFLLPSFWGRTIGWGDIKLAAVIGFVTGWQGLLLSLLGLGLTMGIFYLLLIQTKRGNLKSKIAIGPFLSLGMMFSVLFDRFIKF